MSAVARLALVVLVAALVLPPSARAWDRSSPPTEPWELTSIRLLYGYTDGRREGIRSDGQLVGVPYLEHAAGAEFELEHYDGRTPGHHEYPDFLGVALGLRMIIRAGAVVASDYPQPAEVSGPTGPRGWAAPLRFSLGGGTMAQIVRADDFVLAAHFSFELLASRSTWGPDVAFLLYPGARMVFQPGPVRLQLAYDFLPFWIGQPRIEHRASAAIAFQLGSVGLGVRFTAAIGQEQRREGGLDDLTLGGGLELVL